MYKALVFDIDGTIVDTHYLLNGVRDAYEELKGRPVKPEVLDLMYGSPVSATQSLLELSDRELEEFNRLFALHLPKYVQEQRIYDGIRPTMEALRAMGLILAINTSRTREGALEASQAMDWDFAGYCDYIVSCDQVEHPKPAPDSLKLLGKRAGLSMEEILFIGDTDFDSGCARNAGCDFALATWGTRLKLPADYYPKKPEELLEIVKRKA